MGTISERAREEADRVEAAELEELAQAADGTGEGEPGNGEENGAGEDEESTADTGEGAGDPPAEPDAAALELEAETLAVDAAALEKELTRHGKAMAKIIGPTYSDMDPCEGCGGMGVVAPDLFVPPPMVKDPDAFVCEACNGYGARETPSLVGQYATEQCAVCIGRGWRTRTEIEAELEQQRIMGELAAPSPADGPHWDPVRGQYVNDLAVPPPPPSPIWNPVANRWEFPEQTRGES